MLNAGSCSKARRALLGSEDLLDRKDQRGLPDHAACKEAPGCLALLDLLALRHQQNVAMAWGGTLLNQRIRRQIDTDLVACRRAK